MRTAPKQKAKTVLSLQKVTSPYNLALLGAVLPLTPAGPFRPVPFSVAAACGSQLLWCYTLPASCQSWDTVDTGVRTSPFAVNPR